MNRSTLIVFLVVVVALYTCEAYVAKKVCTGGPHDQWTNCGTACPRTCKRSEPRACILRCELNTCRCDEHTVRRESDNRCVKIEDCDKY